MGKFVDITGNKYGKWTVLKRTTPVGESPVKWLCRCECGNEKEVRSGDLKNSSSTSCGLCGNNPNQTDKNYTIGTRINNWIIVDNAPPSSDRHKQYKCKCQKCGREKVIGLRQLKKDSNCYCETGNMIKPIYKDLSGQSTEYLDILERDWLFEKENNVKHKTIWKCRCKNCGNIFSTWNPHTTKSCGCIKSVGENKILKILNNKYPTLKWKYQYHPEIKYKDTNYPPAFDFAFFDTEDNLLFVLEYNGQQHYEVTSGWNNIQGHKKIVHNDERKYLFCKENNFPLEIISYKDFDNLDNIIFNLFNKYNMI